MEDTDRETALRFLHQIRDDMYKDLLGLKLIDESTPKEHYLPENLWAIAKENLRNNIYRGEK